VQLLAEVIDQLPPILVHRDTRTVIDGAHRLAAHRARGRATIRVEWFPGTLDEAFEVAVKANVTHGLPLTLRERRTAAVSLIRTIPNRSDRALAEICGLSHTTISKLRAETPAAAASGREVRLGRDGRRRSTRPQRSDHPAGRGNATNPSAGEIENRAAPLEGGASTRATGASHVTDADPALAATPELALFSSWLRASDIEDTNWDAVVSSLPVSRLYELADEARRRADAWTRLVAVLETRARTRTTGRE